MSDLLEQVYNKGLSDEAKVISHFKNIGFDIRYSTQNENKYEDIDVYINGVSVSIKTQHRGLIHQDISFELVNHLTRKQDCLITAELLSTNNIQFTDIKKLLKAKSWEKGWFYTGKAEYYLIYQGDRIRQYRKQDVIDYIEEKSWVKVRPLTAYTRSYLGGTYRHCNTICGYLKWGEVKHKTYHLPNDI
jgi:hypothetical protein